MTPHIVNITFSPVNFIFNIIIKSSKQIHILKNCFFQLCQLSNFSFNDVQQTETNTDDLQIKFLMPHFTK